MLKKLLIFTMAISLAFANSMFIGNLGDSVIAQTDPTTATFTVDAFVSTTLALNATLYKMKEINGVMDVDYSAPADSVNFGTLQPVTDSEGNVLYMRGETSYAVVMYPTNNSSESKTYSIKQTGTALTHEDGQSTIPDEAFLVIPDFQSLDEWNPGNPQDPDGSGAPGSVASIKSAVDTDNLIYTSDMDGTPAIVRAYVAITGPDSSGKISNFAKGHNGGTGIGGEQVFYDGSTDSWKPVTASQPSGNYSSSITFTLTN